MAPEEFRDGAVEAGGDLEKVLRGEGIGRTGDSKCADVIVVEGLGVAVVHVGVAIAEFGFEAHGDVVPWLPLGDVARVCRLELECEDGDCRCKNLSFYKSGSDVWMVCGC